jgi:hypothetical protein
VTGALAKLARVRGVSWAWNEAAASAGSVPGEREIGVIAQEIEEVFPELVSTSPEGYKQVKYAGLIGVLLQAVKELKAENDRLAERVAALEKLLSDRAPG